MLRCCRVCLCHALLLLTPAEVALCKWAHARCRWLGYAADIQQPLPCYADGAAVHPELHRLMASDPTKLHLPLGYTIPDDGSRGVRGDWTDSTSTNPSTWSTSSLLKFSHSEILARGEAADVVRGQVCVPSHAC